VIERSESLDPMALELEDWPLEAEQIVTGEDLRKIFQVTDG
jgi:hypothetical protein